MQPWPDKQKAAALIFDFFGILYKSRKHGRMLIVEGEFGGKILQLVWPQRRISNTEFGIQFRAKDTRRSLGGALLHSCVGIKFVTVKKHRKIEGSGEFVDLEYVTIKSAGGEVTLSCDGVEADIL